MALSDLFKPKWKHSNPDVRKAALVNVIDSKILAEIAINDKDWSVRIAAIKKITERNKIDL